MQTKATIARGCVAGYPITINFPQSAKTMLSMLQSAAPTGTAGAGGPGANGGGGVTGDPLTVGTQSVMRVTTPAQARSLRGPTDPAERRRASAVFYRPMAYRARARLPIGQHDRMEEYLLADGRVCASDGAAQRRHFPIHLKSVRLRDFGFAQARSPIFPRFQRATGRGCTLTKNCIFAFGWTGCWSTRRRPCAGRAMSHASRSAD